MKMNHALSVGLFTAFTMSCTENTENQVNDIEIDQETVEIENEEGITIVDSDVDNNIVADLEHQNMPELNASIGLPKGWSAELYSSFGSMVSYAVKEGDEPVMFIYSKATSPNFNNGNFPDRTDILIDDFDKTLGCFGSRYDHLNILLIFQRYHRFCNLLQHQSLKYQ